MVAWQPNYEFRFVFECVYSKARQLKRAPSTSSQSMTEHTSIQSSVTLPQPDVIPTVPVKIEHSAHKSPAKFDDYNDLNNSLLTRPSIDTSKPSYGDISQHYSETTTQQKPVANVSNSAWLNEKYAQKSFTPQGMFY